MVSESMWRYFVAHTLVTPIAVLNCPWPVPNVLNMKGKIYGFAGIIYGSGGHFVSNIRLFHQTSVYFMMD